MFPAELYNAIYHNGILLLTLLAATIYGQGASKSETAISFNAGLIWIAPAAFVLVIGTRPVSNVFVDMPGYATLFDNISARGYSPYADWGFNLFSEACSTVMESPGFFVACAALYVTPVIFAMRKAHGVWAFAGVLAIMGSFSFFAYGVNGLRNGLATSWLIAAFAFHDRKWWMLGLMIAAEGMHKSALLPIAAFLTARLYAQPWVYAVIWTACLGAAATYGERISALLGTFTALDEEDVRLAKYTAGAGMGADKGGFRMDFILYSIVPVAIAWALARPQMRKDLFYRRLVCAYLLTNAFWLLVIYASQSNRFAYLSWFMMPWIVVYPFIPQSTPQMIRSAQQVDGSRSSLLGPALVAHFAFTFIMMMFVYKSYG